MQDQVQVSEAEINEFKRLIDKYRYDFCKLVYVIFPFGEPGSELEDFEPYDWQMEEWERLSKHLQDPKTRYTTYRLGVSSGNGAAKTSWGAMTVMMLLYTQRVRGRVTANTDPQLKSVVWPEYDLWFHRARYVNLFFEKFGTSIKAKNPKLANTWRYDTFTWSEESPAAISGLHNKGGCVIYVFEEAPGIPANIFNYASGAFTETGTIKLHFAFGNSDDPESKFEQNMQSPIWHSRRIDTRTLKHIDPQQIADWLAECGGDEDHDDFRVRVRGLPRKSAKDAIISLELVDAALSRRHGFDKDTVAFLPVVLACDPAWTGGDDTCIWYQQGNYKCLLEKYKLDRDAGETHQLTYQKLCEWERILKADGVRIDQAEGTAIYTLALNDGKTSWMLINFSNSPTDTPEFKDSQYANLRAQMYYETKEDLLNGAVLDARKEEWIEDIRKQLCWTKGDRHKKNLKKLAEDKKDLKDRVGQSPDVADGCVLLKAHPPMDRLPENTHDAPMNEIGQGAFKMPDHGIPDYEDFDEYF